MFALSQTVSCASVRGQPFSSTGTLVVPSASERNSRAAHRVGEGLARVVVDRRRDVDPLCAVALASRSGVGLRSGIDLRSSVRAARIGRAIRRRGAGGEQGDQRDESGFHASCLRVHRVKSSARRDAVGNKRRPCSRSWAGPLHGRGTRGEATPQHRHPQRAIDQLHQAGGDLLVRVDRLRHGTASIPSITLGVGEGDCDPPRPRTRAPSSLVRAGRRRTRRGTFRLTYRRPSSDPWAGCACRRRGVGAQPSCPSGIRCRGDLPGRAPGPS